MGMCFSSGRSVGPEKSQVRFPARLDTILRDADLQRSTSRGRSTRNGESASGETRLKDANDVQRSRTKPTVRKTLERKLPSIDKKLCPNPSSRKSLDREVSVPSIRKPVDGRLPSTASTRKTSDRRTGSTASTRKSVVTNKLEERRLAEAFGLHKGREDFVDSTKTEGSGWQSLDHLVKETLRESDFDGRTKMSRYSPVRRSPGFSSPNVHGDDRPRDHGHSRMSPGLTGVQVGRRSVDRKRAERKPTERRPAEERKPVESKSEEGNAKETKTVDRSQSMERKRVAQRKVVEKRPVDRKSGDTKLVETVKSATPERKPFVNERKSVDRKSMERVRQPAEKSGSAPTTLNDNRRSLDRVKDFSPDHNSKTIRKPRARNGYFGPEAGSPKSLPNARPRRPGVDPRLKTNSPDLDFLRQKFLIDNSEKTIEARLQSSLSDGRSPGLSDHADPTFSSNDFRSVHQIDEFTKSCRESAARAAARDLDSFKNLTSLDSSDSSGTMLRSY